MSFQTYCFELLQTRGQKGKALRRAMELWTITVAKFLELAADRYDELDEMMGTPEGRRRVNKWVYDNLKLIPELSLMEPTMKLAVCNELHSGLKSYFALKAKEFEPGFPTGRLVKEDDFAGLLDEFADCGHTDTPERQFVTLAGLVSGCGKKSEYLPIEFHYYRPDKGFFIAKSERGNYFAGMYIEPGNSGFTPQSDDLLIVGTGERVVARKKPCRLFPLAMNSWLQRKLDTYIPATSKVVERNGRFFLHVSVKVPDGDIAAPRTIIGVDLGKRRIAAASVLTLGGQWIASASVDGLHVNQIKEIAVKVAKAQKRGSHYRYRYGRISKQILHITINKIIDLARDNRAIVVIEELANLRKANVSSCKNASNRGRKSNTYGKFREIMMYKCKAAGITVEEVSPAYTSQTCSKCGHIDPKNRLVLEGDRVTRFKFRCTACGFDHDNSDEIAAINIGRKYLYKKECIETKRKSKSATNRSWQEFVQQMCAG